MALPKFLQKNSDVKTPKKDENKKQEFRDKCIDLLNQIKEKNEKKYHELQKIFHAKFDKINIQKKFILGFYAQLKKEFHELVILTDGPKVLKKEAAKKKVTKKKAAAKKTAKKATAKKKTAKKATAKKKTAKKATAKKKTAKKATAKKATAKKATAKKATAKKATAKKATAKKATAKKATAKKTRKKSR